MKKLNKEDIIIERSIKLSKLKELFENEWFYDKDSNRFTIINFLRETNRKLGQYPADIEEDRQIRMKINTENLLKKV